MKKFVFALCLFFPSILASECYAQFDLDELMETVKTEESAESSTSETSAEASAIEPTADETVSEAEDSVPQDEAEVFEKSLDNLFADDMNTAIGTEKSEKKADAGEDASQNEKIEEIPTGEIKNDVSTDTAPENTDNKADTKAINNAEAVTEKTATATEAESTTDPTNENTIADKAKTEEIDIFADDKVDDLFDEPSPAQDNKKPALQDATNVLPVDSDSTNQIAKDDFMDDYFEDLEKQKQRDEAAYKAQKDALRLISGEPQVVTLKDEQRLSLRESNQKRKEMERQLKAAKAKQPPLTKPETYAAEKIGAEEIKKTEEKQEVETSDEPKTSFTAEAPFGLRWNAGKDEIEAMGFTTAPAEMDNYEGVYVVRNPQQPQKIFTLVTAVFGAHNHLQAIYAQSMPTEDTPQADNVLKLYHQYYDALEKKYGNAQEHFVPNTKPAPEAKKAVSKDEGKDKNEDKNEDEGAEKTETTENEETAVEEKPTAPSDNGIGNDNFLKELKEEDAALFATFGDDNVKVTLMVLADEKGKSYITLDYENKYVLKQEQSANFDALLNDL